MSAIEQCRSLALGGQRCAVQRARKPQIAYNSCRNRHCPKCQSSAAQRWLEARQADLLPVEYYHVVFTLPAPISAIAYTNKEIIYGLLFDIAAETLRTIAADPKHLGARIGTTLVLHTWGSALTHHPHVHGIVPGGGLAPDAERWVPASRGSSSRCAYSRGCSAGASSKSSQNVHRDGQLKFFGEHVDLADAEAFADWLMPLRQCEWVVYAKRPFAGPEAVLAYLSRYTHRVAISNRRLMAWMIAASPSAGRTTAHTARTRYKTMTSSDRRVHAPLPAARAALRLSSHPPLWPARQRQPQEPHRHGTRAAASAAPDAVPLITAMLRRTRLWPTHLRVPALRRADARHRDLRACSAHPRTAGFIDSNMIEIALINETSPAASSSTMPSRTPMTPCRKTFHCRHDNRFLKAACQCVLPSLPTHFDHAVATIFVTSVSADRQIPIVPRHC